MSARIGTKAMDEVKRALQEYRETCWTNLGTDISRETYFRYAERFVRWMDGDFTPGKMRPK
ncbi:MAG: hypothetical protein ACRKGH_05655 [Dehalogenimonas sp.]